MRGGCHLGRQEDIAPAVLQGHQCGTSTDGCTSLLHVPSSRHGCPCTTDRRTLRWMSWDANTGVQCKTSQRNYVQVAVHVHSKPARRAMVDQALLGKRFAGPQTCLVLLTRDRKSTRLNSSH